MANKDLLKPTSAKYCKNCIYGTNEASSYVICNYYLMTKEHRNCKVGECDKFEKSNSKNMANKQKWADSMFEMKASAYEKTKFREI